MSRSARLAGSCVAVCLFVASGSQLLADEPAKGAGGTSPKSSGTAEKPADGAAEKPADESPIDDRFMRVTRNKDGVPQSLDTAVVRYIPAGTPTDAKPEVVVDMVGAVHIGEKAYYRTLNKLFEEYDVVLFELVMAPGTKVPDGKAKNDGMMSGMVKSMLELESQVEKIDYTKKNFVHADMSPEQMGEAMRKRGDNGLTVTLSVITDMIREANRREQKQRTGKARRPAAEVDLFGSNGPLQLKRTMAEQMEESGDAGAFGATLTTMLIVDRNEACVKVLDRELKAGRKKVAVYYGAAHLPDFDKRLKGEFGLKPDKTTWLTAWDLAD